MAKKATKPKQTKFKDSNIPILVKVPLDTSKIIVKPLVVDTAKKHTLAQLFEGNSKNLPLLKSVGFGRIEESGNWISYVITSQGKEIVSIEVSDPDQRAIAEDNAKTSFITELVDQGL